MELPLKSRRILVFVDDVYEDLELWYPKLRLQEAGAEVVVAGPKAGEVYSGKHGYPCRSDAAIGEMRSADFSGVVLPGGFMPDKLRRDPRVLELVREFSAASKLVAAICHGGWIAISAESSALPRPGMYRLSRDTQHFRSFRHGKLQRFKTAMSHRQSWVLHAHRWAS